MMSIVSTHNMPGSQETARRTRVPGLEGGIE